MQANEVKALIREAIDLHVHIGPEVIPRKYTAQSLAAVERGKLAGAVTKNHFYPTVFATAAERPKDFLLVPGLVLNGFVGGLNPEAVYATALLAGSQFVVWLPTVHAEQFLRSAEYEIAPEWVQDKSLRLRKAGQVTPMAVTADGKLTEAARRTLDAVAAAGAVLATGHIAWEETELVVAYARKCGIRSIIVTHPIYQHIAMPLEMQRRLAAKGCFMEQCYSMYRLDGIPLDAIAAQIQAIGPESVVLSSDVGQAFSPSPSEALTEFCRELLARGITLADLRIMLVTNPHKILGIPR